MAQPDLTGDEIKHLREANRLTQRDLAERLGVGERTVSNWERGTTVPRNRMGMMRELFGLTESNGDPLGALSDSALLTELLRRTIAREHGRSNAG